MTEDELELRILQRFVAQHEAVGTAGVGEDDKCARELDMRDVIRELTGKEGPALEYHSNLWFKRLVERPSQHGVKAPLRPCSRGDKFRARAFTAKHLAPAWDRIRELEPRVAQSQAATPQREMEQKFRILSSAGQAIRDFAEWSERGRSVQTPISLLFMDIDDFKSLNTRFTETRVDATLLPQFQHLLDQLTRNRGHAYRQGGDEFIVLLANHTVDEARSFAERMRATVVGHAFVVDGTTIQLSVSIGVAQFPDDGGDFETVLHIANLRKQTAKDQGRNRVILEQSKGKNKNSPRKRQGPKHRPVGQTKPEPEAGSLVYRRRRRDEKRDSHLAELRTHALEAMLVHLDEYVLPILQHEAGNVDVCIRQVRKPTGLTERPSFEQIICVRKVTEPLQVHTFGMDVLAEMPDPPQGPLVEDARRRHFPQLFRTWDLIIARYDAYNDECLHYVDALRQKILKGNSLLSEFSLSSDGPGPEWVNAAALAVIIFLKQISLPIRELTFEARSDPRVWSYGSLMIAKGSVSKVIALEEQVEKLVAQRTEVDELLSIASSLRADSLILRGTVDEQRLMPKLLGNCPYI